MTTDGRITADMPDRRQTMNLIPRPLRSAAGKVYRAAMWARIRLSPDTAFHAQFYIRLNQRRQEHLDSLGLPIAGASVLEVAAGIGDHTSFFLDRGCTVVSTEGRSRNLARLRKNLAHFRKRYPALDVRHLDLERPADLGQTFDIVYCYGALYHLCHPAEALAFMARHCRKMLLLETCVSFGDTEAINLVDEKINHPTQSMVGRGCRPTRPWIHAQLRQHFDFVYVPRTQPNHEEFPLDWNAPPSPPEPNARAVFIASRQPLENPKLTQELLAQQVRQG
jgi:SAM-dependent methyltransferase